MVRAGLALVPKLFVLARHPVRISQALAWRWKNWRRRIAHRPVAMPVSPWLGLPREAARPPFGLFHDIAIVPPTHSYTFGRRDPGHDLCCGPVFPAEGVEPWMRHCIVNHINDTIPKAPAGPQVMLTRPCVWLGYMHLHFGHLVAEHMTRALWSRTMRPDDLYLFALPPGYKLKWTDPGFLDILAWYGLSRAQLLQVTVPLRAREMRVYPQAELLLGDAPSASYLEVQDKLLIDSRLTPIRSDILFVTRRGMLANGTGSHAAEAYLCRLLAQSGVRVLDPATAPLKAQLAAYSGARQIVFSEGSAMHGRQLLGRLDQTVTVLNRRPGARIGEASLRSRCREVSFVEVTAHAATPQAIWGGVQQNDALCLYDTDVLKATFGGLGVDLARQWNDNAYRQEVRQDAAVWVQAMAHDGRGYGIGMLRNLADQVLEKAGLLRTYQTE
jgi:hypothetical protein